MRKVQRYTFIMRHSMGDALEYMDAPEEFVKGRDYDARVSQIDELVKMLEVISEAWNSENIMDGVDICHLDDKVQALLTRIKGSPATTKGGDDGE